MKAILLAVLALFASTSALIKPRIPSLSRSTSTRLAASRREVFNEVSRLENEIDARAAKISELEAAKKAKVDELSNSEIQYLEKKMLTGTSKQSLPTRTGTDFSGGLTFQTPDFQIPDFQIPRVTPKASSLTRTGTDLGGGLTFQPPDFQNPSTNPEQVLGAIVGIVSLRAALQSGKASREAAAENLRIQEEKRLRIAEEKKREAARRKKAEEAAQIQEALETFKANAVSAADENPVVVPLAAIAAAVVLSGGMVSKRTAPPAPVETPRATVQKSSTSLKMAAEETQAEKTQALTSKVDSRSLESEESPASGLPQQKTAPEPLTSLNPQPSSPTQQLAPSPEVARKAAAEYWTSVLEKTTGALSSKIKPGQTASPAAEYWESAIENLKKNYVSMIEPGTKNSQKNYLSMVDPGKIAPPTINYQNYKDLLEAGRAAGLNDDQTNTALASAGGVVLAGLASISQSIAQRKEAVEMNPEEMERKQKAKAEKLAKAKAAVEEKKAKAQQEKAKAKAAVEEKKAKAIQEKAKAKAEVEERKANAQKEKAEKLARAKAEAEDRKAKAEQEKARVKAEVEEKRAAKAKAKAEAQEKQPEAEQEKAKVAAEVEETRVADSSDKTNPVEPNTLTAALEASRLKEEKLEKELAKQREELEKLKAAAAAKAEGVSEVKPAVKKATTRSGVKKTMAEKETAKTEVEEELPAKASDETSSKDAATKITQEAVLDATKATQKAVLDAAPVVVEGVGNVLTAIGSAGLWAFKAAQESWEEADESKKTDE